MINPISSHGALPNGIPSAGQPQLEPATSTEAGPNTAAPSTSDVVQLSDSAQAKLMKQQGLDLAEIAIKLGLDVKTVSGYFPSVSVKAAG